MLSIVVPVYNEANSLERLLAEIHSAVSGREELELICVDDGSDDATPERLVALKRAYPRLRVLAHRERFGQSAAIWSGVNAARAEWVATLDGDGQNDPADIPKLLDVLRNREAPTGLQMVVGHRRHRKDNWVKRWSSRTANAVAGRILGDQTPDAACGLKVFRRSAFLALPYFNNMHRFMPALIQRDGGRVMSVEVHHRPRAAGSSKYGVWDRLWVGVVDLFGVSWLRRRGKYPVLKPEN